MKWVVLTIWLPLLLLNSLPLPAQEPIENVAARVIPAVVTVLTYDTKGEVNARGSGFFIDQYHVITNWHVIDGAATIQVKTSDNKTYAVKSTAVKDTASDLVSLALTAPNTKVKPLKVVGTLPKVGERVIAVGSPQGIYSATVTEGIVSSVRDVPGYGKMIQLQNPVSKGDSGGPVVNMKGEVVGVIAMGESAELHLNFAIPGDRVLALLSGKPSVPAGAGAGPAVAANPVATATRYIEAENYTGAIPYLQEAVKRDPDSAAAWFLMGHSYYMLDRYNEAVPALLKALRLNSDNYIGWTELGVSLGMQGDEDHAVQALKQAINIEPDYPNAHLFLGAVYLDTGDRPSAIAEYETLKTLNPEMAEYLYNAIYE